MKKLVLFGNGDYAEAVYHTLADDSVFEIAGFTVNAQYIEEKTFLGLPVVAFEEVESVFSPTDHEMLLPISFQRLNQLRQERYEQAKAKGYALATYVSSNATRRSNSSIGENCLVFEYSCISPGAKVGNNVTICQNVLIGHHVVVEDHCFISPGAVLLGGVTVGAYS